MKKIPGILILIICALFTSLSFAHPPLQKLTVILDWFPNPDHAPLIIAKQQGFFKEQGLDVELIGPSDPTDPAKWVAAKKADLGLTYEPEFFVQVDHGLPLVRIGTLIDKPLNCLVALKDSGIKELSDLKGKRIGTTSSGLTSVMLRMMLAKAGLKPSDVQLINIRYSATQALLSHQIDATTSMMRNVEVPLLESKGYKAIAFFPEENGIPSYSELVFISNTANSHDPRFPRFLNAVKKAVAYLDEHPNETWQQFAKAYPESNNKVNREIWFATMPYFAEDPASLDTEEWAHFALFMQENKMIKTAQSVSRYAVTFV